MRRLKTRDGDWYVETSDRDWPAAIERSKAAAQERDRRMRAWEQANSTNGYPPASYWERYTAEKYRVPIDWPVPKGHVMFKRVA